MKNTQKLLILLMFVSLVLFVACSKDDNDMPSSPIVSEIAENVVTILDENSNLISSPVEIENGIYIFEFNSEVPEIQINDIIVGDEGEGFLRKVTSVIISDNNVVLETTQASMDELFNSGTVEFSTNITQGARMSNVQSSQVKVNYNAPGVAMNNDGLSYDFSNVMIYEDASGHFEITNGNATFNPNFFYKADYSLFSGLEYLEFKADNANLELNCNFDLTTTGSLNLVNFNHTLLDYDKRIAFLVGGIPVIITINTKLEAQLSTAINTNISLLSSWTNSNQLTTGIKYQNGIWTGNYDASSNLNLNSIDIGGEVDVVQSLIITPRVSVKFYGVIAPYCQPQLSENFNFNIASPELNWNSELKAGLDITTGVDVTVLGKTIADFNRNDSFEQSLWRAPSSLEIVSGNEQIGTISEPLSESLKVKVTDTSNGALPNVQVYFDVIEGNGNVSSSKVSTDTNGYAETNWTLGDVEDVVQLVRVSIKDVNNNVISTKDFTAETGFSLVGSWSLVQINGLSIGEWDAPECPRFRYLSNGNYISFTTSTLSGGFASESEGTETDSNGNTICSPVESISNSLSGDYESVSSTSYTIINGSFIDGDGEAGIMTGSIVVVDDNTIQVSISVDYGGGDVSNGSCVYIRQ